MNRQEPQIPTAPWITSQDIDWELVTRNYYLQAEECLRRFAAEQNGDPVYGLILQVSQNWLLDVHLNTVSAKAEIASRMRDVANWAGGMTDSELLAGTGCWYHPTWRYGNLSLRYDWVYRTVDDFNYECFWRIFSAADNEDSYRMGMAADDARIRAAQRILDSSVLAGLLKTPDFQALIVNDDGLVPPTNEHPETVVMRRTANGQT